MADYTFFTNPMSRGQIARWALHEAGADYDTQLVDWGNKSRDFLDTNPMGKVPTLVHHLGDHTHTITETAAICAYLAEASAPDLLPREEERADYLRWLFFAAGPVEQAVFVRAMGWELAEGKQMTAGFGSYDQTIDTLEQHFKDNAFTCGDRFTMADVYVGSQVIWGLQFESIPARDAFSAYAERLTARGAYKAANAIDTKLIAEMQSND